MHHPPKLSYSGLTIILSQPSRFDTTELLSGNSGNWFSNECIRPGINRFQCDIYDLATFNRCNRILLDGTRCILSLGHTAQKEVMGVDETVSLGEQRGSPVHRDGITYISSYLPQDAFDFKDFESYLNPHLNGQLRGPTDMDTVDEEDNDGDEKSRHGKTSRGNYRFWLKRDTKKIIRILKEGWKPIVEPEYRIYPSSNEVIETLRAYENTDFYLDIETDSDLNITCFGFSFGDTNIVWVVPVLRYNYTTAYTSLGSIFRSLAIAMHKNTTVSHNGSGFDWFVLPFKYSLPFGRSLYDTMIAHHRCFPEIEKSLGHAISNFTNLPYHKNEGIFEPQNQQQEEALWQYNGKDVFSMREVKRGITEYATSIRGLSESINQANASIRPYLTTTLQGIRYRREKVNETISNNDRALNQIVRMIVGAIGEEHSKFIKGSSKNAMPGSNKQCVKYFHGLCGYPIVGYGKETKEGKRNPSLNEKNMYKLAIKCGDKKNPVIDLVLAYRGLAKESGSLKFNDWVGVKKLCA